MMKILIAYAGKSGTCARAAHELKALLPQFDVTVADLTESAPPPAGYDFVVLGGAVRFGKLHRAARGYAKKYRDVLQNTPHSLFLCCAYPDFLESYAGRGFPSGVQESAKDLLYFGGELNVAAQKGVDRLIARRMRTVITEDEDGDGILPGYLPEHVRLFAAKLQERLQGK